MPPRRTPVKRNKPSTAKAATPVNAHESPAPKVNPEAKLSDDLKVKETVPEISVQEEVSDPNRAEIVVVGVSSESMSKEEVTEARNEEDLRLGSEAVETDDLQEEDTDDGKQGEDEDVGSPVDGNQSEQDAEINSAQEETPAVQVDGLKTLNGNNNDVQDSCISNSLSKNNDATEIASVQESAQPVSTQTSPENNTALAVEDDSMENMYDDEIDDDSEGDDADNGGDEDQDQDQDPSFIVEDSSPDNKKEKGTEIYVGKLDKNAVEDDLVKVFQQFGELKSTRIVRKPTTNKSKGFAFVRFASVDQAKRALSELKDGVEVKGKRIVISASQDNDTLYLGNICKTWTKEQVLQQLKDYGIENIEVLRVPEDTKADKKNKGFAFLEFSTHSDAVAAFKRLKKSDVVFGRDITAKVAFAETPKHTSDEDLLQVNKVHLEGITKDWTEEKVKDLCKSYGEIVDINLRPSTRNKHKDFGFVTFNSPESALACVEGINNTAVGGDTKIKASIARPQQKGVIQRQGSKSSKQSENSNKKSQAVKSSKMKGVLNAQQTKTNKKLPSKNKGQGPLKKDGESSLEAKLKGDNDSQQGKRKRKGPSEQKLNARDPKKPRNVGQGQNSQSASKAGSNKRKGNEVRDRNAQGKRPFKKQKGNMHGRERDNARRPKGDAHTRRGHDDYRNSTRYIDPYVPKYNAYQVVASDHSLPTRRYKEMEPHAGYIEPGFAKQSSGYAQPPVARAPPVYASTGQSQLYSRYLDQPVIHRGGYIEAAVAPEVQHYRDYRPSANLHVARGSYDSGLARVRHDDRGAGGVTYAGGPSLPASQVPNRANYYQVGGSYGGGYTARGGYY